MPGLGPIQRQIRRAFLANPDAELKTGELVKWAYPRLTGKPTNNHRYCVRRAAAAVAVCVRHERPGGFVWVVKPSQMLPKLRDKTALREKAESQQGDSKSDL